MDLPLTRVDQRVVTVIVHLVDQVGIFAKDELDLLHCNFDVGIFALVGVDRVEKLLPGDFVGCPAVVLKRAGCFENIE